MKFCMGEGYYSFAAAEVNILNAIFRFIGI